MEVWVAAADVADVALEVLNVNCVKPDDGGVEADVLLCQAVTEVERTAGFCEVCFGTVQRLEELSNSLLVRVLGSKGRGSVRGKAEYRL